VQPGDTLGAIARRFGTTVTELVRINNITNPDALQVGQKLTVPGAGGGAAVNVPAAGQGKSYTVQRGDTLLSIARRFGLTVKQLQAANNITNPDRIYPGQVLTIP
jgi:putative chitinase